MKRLGLVGVGAWGRRYIEAINRRADCCIVAFARASGQATPLLAARRVDGWPELIELGRAGELDAIIVATNPDNQAEVTDASIAAAIPVLVEKPLGLSWDRARRVQQRFQDAVPQPTVVVNHIHLFSPAYCKLKGLIQSHANGKDAIARVVSQGCNNGPFRTWSSLYDYGPHDIALCLDLLGTDANCHIRTARRHTPDLRSGGEVFEARLDFDDVTADIQVGNGDSKSRRFVVELKDGCRLVYDDLRPHPFKLVADEKPVAIDSRTPLDCVVDYFLSLIAKAATPGLNAKEAGGSLALAVRVAEILDAIQIATR